MKPTFTREERFLLRHPSFARLALSRNSVLTPEILDRYGVCLDWFNVIENPSIIPNVSFFDRHVENIPFAFKSVFPFCVEVLEGDFWTLELVRKFEPYWNWEALAQNSTLLGKTEIVVEYFDKLGLEFMSIMPDDLHGDKKYNSDFGYKLHKSDLKRQQLSCVSTWEEAFRIKGIEWFDISRAENLPWSESKIEEHYNEWDWTGLSFNEALPWSEKLIRRYEDRWDWWINKEDFSSLSLNTKIPWNHNMLRDYADMLQIDFVHSNTAMDWSIDLLEAFEDIWTFYNADYNATMWEKVFKPKLQSTERLLDELSRNINVLDEL